MRPDAYDSDLDHAAYLGLDEVWCDDCDDRPAVVECGDGTCRCLRCEDEYQQDRAEQLTEQQAHAYHAGLVTTPAERMDDAYAHKVAGRR